MAPAFCGYRTFSCAWCGNERTVSARKENNKIRFCNTSCSAKWRMSQPEIKAKIHTPETYRKVVAAKKGKKYPKLSKWWTENNPMKNPESREKVRQWHLENKHEWKTRGGNGRGPTDAERALLPLLVPHGFEYNVVVPTKLARVLGLKMPTSYKIDIAHRSRKVAIEVDGGSHRMLPRQEQDKRKDKILSFLGWKVVRVTNEVALTNPKSILELI